MTDVDDQNDETDRWISGNEERDVTEAPIARGTCIGGTLALSISRAMTCSPIYAP